MSEDVSKEDIEENENKEQDEDEEENNATAAFANNVITNRTNKSNNKAFGELTFSKGDDFVVESSPKNKFPSKEDTQPQPQQNPRSITFKLNDTEEIKHQTLQYTNPNYNEISNIMNDQLLISKSSLLTNIREVTTTPNIKVVQISNINDVNAVSADNNNSNHFVNEGKLKSEMNANSTPVNHEVMKRKRNSMNSGFGETWIPPSSLSNTLNNNVNNNSNAVLSQEQPNHQIQAQAQPQQVNININQSLQMINKELDIITENINESISGGRFYNKRNNYGCSCYDGSLLIHNSNNDYTQYTQNDIMKRKYNTNFHSTHPPFVPNPLVALPTQNQRYNEYSNMQLNPNGNNNNTNSVLTSFRTASKTNSRVLYNLQGFSQTNIFT